MKLILILLFVPLLSLGQSERIRPNIQSTYVDAVNLQKYCNSILHGQGDPKDVKEKIKVLLKRYGIDIEGYYLKSEPWAQSLLEAYYARATGGNPKFNGDKSSLDEFFNIGNMAVPKTTVLNPSSGISWESSVINGISTFMAKRFKQESFYFALNQYFKHVSKDQQALVGQLFPDTFTEIQRLNKSQDLYAVDLVVLRQIVEDDLIDLPKRFSTEPKQVFPKISDEFSDVIKISGLVKSSLDDGNSLPDLFKNINDGDYENGNIRNILSMNLLVSEALRDTLGSQRSWIDVSFLKNESVDSKVRNFFLGLLQQQLKPFVPQINDAEISYFVTEIVPILTELNSMAIFVKKHNNDLNKEASLELLGKLSELLHRSFELYAQKINYNIPNKGFKAFNSLFKIQQAYAAKNYRNAMIVLLREMNDYWSDTLTAESQRQVMFLVQLAEINNPDEVEGLLESYALPIGGSSIKRKSKFNVSLNSYVGLTAGGELAYGTAKQTKTNIGLAAPIGISITYTKKHSVTLFTSIIDLGTIVNLRLNNHTTAFSDLKFEQFIAPGVGLYYNIDDTPITFGVHYNYIPNLRNIQLEEDNLLITETKVSVSRLNASILIDIPLYTFYNKK